MLETEEIEKISHLARIELNRIEVEKFRKEVSAVLDFVGELKKVDTEGVEEILQVTGLENVQRTDTPVMSDLHDGIFSQAPEMKDRYFKVKAIL